METLAEYAREHARTIKAVVLTGFGALSLATITGCHSHYVQAQIVNGSRDTLSVIQVDYPSASFGVQQLSPGQTFRYRFKILGSGALKLTWTDGSNKQHTEAGPSMHEGQEGNLDIDFESRDHAAFVANLRP